MLTDSWRHLLGNAQRQSAGQTNVSEPWSDAEKGVLGRQQVAPWQTAAGEMSATASDKPLSGADDQHLGIVSAQEPSTAANVVLKRPASVNQLSSTAACGSSPCNAAASVATCRLSHSKHPRTVTNHSPRRQSVRDAPSVGVVVQFLFTGRTQFFCGPCSC